MRSRGILLVILAGALFGLAPAGTASADGIVVASEPRPRQQLTEPPGWVTLAFDREVDPGVAKVLVLNSQGENVTDGELIVEGTNVTTQLAEDLPRDTYTVMYRVDRSDGDVRGGAFQFAYGQGRWTSLPDANWSGSGNEPTIMADPDPNAGSKPPVASPSSSATPGSATPTPSPTPTPTPSATASESATPSPAGSPPAAPADQGGGALPWIIGAAVLAAAGAGVLAIRRRQQG